MNNSPHFKKYFKPSFLYIAIAFLIVAFNSYELWVDTFKVAKQRKEIPFFFSGFKFLGLEEIFHHTAYVGYYTDKDLPHDKLAAAEFGQAQYILAPTILDLNNLNHEFILFNCSSEKIAFEKIKEIKALPMKRNSFGVILARKIQ